MHEIRIGTLTPVGPATPETLDQLIPLGFECFAFTYWQKFGEVEPQQLAGMVMDKLRTQQIQVSALSLFANVLADDEEGELARQSWRKMIDAARLFDCDLVTGFTGRLPGSIPDNIARFKEVWTPLAEYAGEKGVRIAWENCSMGGSWNDGHWNIAHNPDAWELMFDAIPLDNVGLEWEPCHQMVQLIEPLPQIMYWHHKFFHIHGKDATIRRDIIARHGISGPEAYVWHRTPGFGDSNWTDIISELRRYGYRGNIDIEGWHDPVYRGELEMTGQVHALNYLKQCRGGNWTALRA